MHKLIILGLLISTFYCFSDNNKKAKQSISKAENHISNSVNSGCQAGQFLDKSTNQCQPCLQNCSVCENSYSCKLCLSGFFQFNDSCVEKCPFHYFGSQKSKQCEECNIFCESCNGSSENDCETCVPGLVIQNNECVSDCGYGQYADFNSQSCKPCSSKCADCDKQKDFCTACKQQGYFLFIDRGDCEKQCPTHEYYEQLLPNQIFKICQHCHSSCFQCSGPEKDQCIACYQGFELKDNQCVSDCLEGQFMDKESKKCEFCDESCLTCKGPFDDECITCREGYMLNDIEQCVDPNEFQPLSSSNFSLVDLFLCDEGLYYFQGECRSTCPHYFYKDNSSRNCEQCFNDCVACFGPLEEDCLTCQKKQLYHGMECVDKCPPQYFKQQKVCQPCHGKCYNCKGLESNQCTRCIKDHFLFEGQCVATCPEKYYQDFKKGKCMKCDPNCVKCFGPTEEECDHEHLNILQKIKNGGNTLIIEDNSQSMKNIDKVDVPLEQQQKTQKKQNKQNKKDEQKKNNQAQKMSTETQKQENPNLKKNKKKKSWFSKLFGT